MGFSCPECVNGKCVNCAGLALDPNTDEMVACACAIDHFRTD